MKKKGTLPPRWTYGYLPPCRGRFRQSSMLDVSLLVQLADRCGRHLAATQSFGNILHPAHLGTSQVYLDQRLFHAAFPAAISLDDSSFKRDTFETGNMERDVAGRSSKIPVIMAAAVALMSLISLMAGSLSASCSSTSFSVSSTLSRTNSLICAGLSNKLDREGRKRTSPGAA